MLRITDKGSLTTVTIRLDGKLLGPWVGELRSIVCAAGAKGSVCLEIDGLRFADADGLALLRAFRAAGIPLIGASPLIEGLLGASCQTAMAGNDCPRKPD